MLTQNFFATLNQINLTLVRHLWKDNVWYFRKNNNFWQAAELFVKLFELHRKKRKNKRTCVFHAACLRTLIRGQLEIQWLCWLKKIFLDKATANMSFIRISWIYCLRIYSVSTCVDMKKNSIPMFSKFGTFSAINKKSKFLETSFNFWALLEKTRKICKSLKHSKKDNTKFFVEHILLILNKN